MRRLLHITASLSILFTTASCALFTPRLTVAPEALSEGYAPKGRLEVKWYDTKDDGPSRRKMVVYLPEGYDKDTSLRYPALYLLHGARGNETSWVLDGNILPHADSLFENGLARKCIIVMPNMNSYENDEDFDNSRFKAPVESFFEVDGTVETYFRRDVVAFVDSAYRTIPDKDHRALCGLSIGAMQSIHMSATWPEDFAYIGLFSPMYKSVIKKGENSCFYSHLEDNQPEQFANPPYIYHIMIGRKDIYFGHMKKYRKYLDANGYPFLYTETGGGHRWDNWQTYSVLFLQELWYKDTPAAK